MKKKILLVEDEVLVALAEKELLESQGYVVVVAAAGARLWNTTKRERPFGWCAPTRIYQKIMESHFRRMSILVIQKPRGLN
jgi:CheY-like chemotaxis protein